MSVTADRRGAALAQASGEGQSEVTPQLARQVRQAVELLVGALSRADGRQGGDLLPMDGDGVYDAAVTVMMRLLFCLYAEERGLLPAGDPAYEAAYAVGGLLERLDGRARSLGPEVLEHDTTGWQHLLAAFRAIHGGVTHEDLVIPAYGGGLFDPDRYPFLEGRAEALSLPKPVDDRTVLALLRALQELEIGGQTRRVSYRTLDIEQIGHVYEGLLDRRAVRVDAVYLGLGGKHEPTIALDELEAEHTSDAAAALVLRDVTGLSERQVLKALATEVDADARRLLLLACENDTRLADRIRPYLGIVRRDLRGIPVVIGAGAMMVTPTSARRDSGTQYTTRELADEIAIDALEPLVFVGPAEGAPREDWQLRTSAELLALKVCDPAAGSGAILVAALRYLSERLLEAWEAEGAHDDLPPDDRLVMARSDVAERCLYGVDRDPLALEMAKLSLWLCTMSPERPFTFLDHGFKCGDALLGITTIGQLRDRHLDPARGRRIVSSLARPRPAAQILAQGLDELNALGDRIVAAAMVASYRKPLEYDAALVDGATGDGLQAGLPDGAPPRRPLHWPLAFPEVFLGAGREGFDAIVGNPPFRGGQHLTESLGVTYRDYLVGHVAEGRAGSADLVAYFFLRAGRLTRPGGQIGFIATNSVAQGQTKRVGLDGLRGQGWQIRKAVRERPWPGGAVVFVAQVWLSDAAWSGGCVLDSRIVGSITTGLTDGGRPNSSAAPKIAANRGLMFQGSIPVGGGFVNLPAAFAADLLQDDDVDYAAVIRPYLGAADICDRPDQSASRWCIDFGYMTFEEASRFPRALEYLEANARRQRMNNAHVPTSEHWWRFGAPRREMRKALLGLDRFIVVPNHAKRYLTAWQPAIVLAGNAASVLASRDDYVMGVMTSRIHEIWARSRPSSIKGDLRYTPSTMFETFPFPPEPAPAFRQAVAGASEALHARRRELCLEAHVGLTELYNRADGGAFAQLRALHESLDLAVAGAYGWPGGVLEADDAILACLVELSQAIAGASQCYEPAIRPQRPTAETAGRAGSGARG
ncbi:MAG: hypothetical protein QOJ46_2592 [bacterium]